MVKIPMVFSNGVAARYSSFSDDVVCVEVEKNGRDLGSFCTDIHHFEEWEEEELISLIEQHVKKVEGYSQKKSDKDTLLPGVEVQYYSHSSDVYCINVFYQGNEVSSFCADRVTFEEWMEDKELLSNVVKNLIPQVI
ncbi:MULTISPECIES: hypothetical protein [Bacillaceae]|uniref:Uncharacterized protein n=1 Tax=Evansella alkalicola TaxID=745819 RepID=A0ABS6K000_9BACI|nr:MULTISPECIES: hypothetical protein [Bacillaceae]MBU9724175.1 hypothetical protein [Bacillus alkalicola]